MKFHSRFMVSESFRANYILQETALIYKEQNNRVTADWFASNYVLMTA